MTAITRIRPEQVKITLDPETHLRLRAIAKYECVSLTALVRGLAERHAAQIDVLIEQWESAA